MRRLAVVLAVAVPAACATAPDPVAPAPLPRVVLTTELGAITVEIDTRRAPATAANFLRHVDEGHLDGATFYRVVRDDNQPQNPVKIAVVQGGLGPDDDVVGPYPPIAHETTRETGIRHQDGTISMARLEPGTATAEFFICVGDQPELDYGGARNPDRQGFAAFGRVVAGMDVVREIHRRPADGQFLEPRIKILEARRALVPGRGPA